MVNEPLVEGGADRGKGYVIATVGEDGAETIGLIIGIGENENAVAVGEKFPERIGYEVEILVV